MNFVLFQGSQGWIFSSHQVFSRFHVMFPWYLLNFAKYHDISRFSRCTLIFPGFPGFQVEWEPCNGQHFLFRIRSIILQSKYHCVIGGCNESAYRLDWDWDLQPNRKTSARGAQQSECMEFKNVSWNCSEGPKHKQLQIFHESPVRFHRPISVFP